MPLRRLQMQMTMKRPQMENSHKETANANLQEDHE